MTFSDSRVAKMLMEDFVPVWESVAAVKTVTFNLGEGRSFRGSISGEIAIYFCDVDGVVMDILPALQSPAATLAAMKEALTLHKQVKDANKQQAKSPKAQFVTNGRQAVIGAFQKKRMTKVATERFEALAKTMGKKMLRRPELIPAGELFPASKAGEKLRDDYIRAAVDKATRDMRTMVMSKTASPGQLAEWQFVGDAMTVVEPGGRGYFRWKVGQAFFGVWPKDHDPRPKDKPGFRFSIGASTMQNPNYWKKPLFEGILKQELKGGEVEYDSDSLQAISIFEE
ncbi:MAG: hypothetical protein AB8F34_06805 [Akkermansiaceae bacterium]